MNPEKEWMLSLVNPFFKIEGEVLTPDVIEIPDSKDSLDELNKRYQTLRNSYGIHTYKVLSSSFPCLYEALEKEKWHLLGREFVLKHAMKESQLGLIVDHFYEYCLKKDLSLDELLQLKKDRAYIVSKRSKFIKSSCIKDVLKLQEDLVLSFQKSVVIVESEALVVSRDEKEIFENLVDEALLKALLAFQHREFKLIELVSFFSNEQELADFVSKAVNGRWLFLIS